MRDGPAAEAAHAGVEKRLKFRGLGVQWPRKQCSGNKVGVVSGKPKLGLSEIMTIHSRKAFRL